MPVPNEIIQEFLVETHDSLGRLDIELVALEKGDSKAETLSSVFRSMHSLKGSAGFLGFQKLEALTHVAESLLSRLRDGKLEVTVEIVTHLLATVDAVRAMLRAIELTGNDGDQIYLELIANLRALTTKEPLPHSLTRSEAMPEPTFDFGITPGGSSVMDSPVAADSHAGLQDSAIENVVPQSVSSKVADSTIRLGVDRVDKMMNLVTELVLSRNQILQHGAVQTDSSLAVAARNLNLITSELQESVMKMRMQPISNVWGALPRVVRDLSLECGKRVRLVMEGADTELDKSVLEAIKDPLMHLVRNAIDHGIETPEQRLAAGKPAEGCLRMRAFHESGHIHIEISDDGAGINRSRVKAKARQNGLLSVEQAENLTDEAVLSLLFLPGFSTRDTVSNLSGRGVGMDVVKSNVERIGGLVDVHSDLGIGTTFKLRIPLTLAIIHALLVTCAGERYAIPQTSMIELIRLDGDRVRTGIERIQGVQVHRYRGKLLPLVSLNQVLGGQGDNGHDSVNIVVLQADQQQFGLIVDRVNDTQEIVVKPLNKLLRGISCLTGATILGDGQVALILDVVGVAERAVGDDRQRLTTYAEAEPEASPTAAEDIQQVVLISGPQGERLAVPLSAVARLEEFPATKIEWTGARPVVQYRDQILPLLDVLNLLGARPSVAPTDSHPVQVVVCTDGTSRVGLVVGRILDIVTDPLIVRSSSAREHVLFTAVVQRQVTEVLNVASLVSAAEAELVRSGGKA
jgi:two-component system chemotaxis sensor kinase CheA